jgi:hypothetical protein
MSEWQTDLPVENAGLKKELDKFSGLYNNLLMMHANLLAAIFSGDNQRIMDQYRYSVNNVHPHNAALDALLRKIVTPPSFLK